MPKDETINKILLDITNRERGRFLEADNTVSFRGVNQKTFNAFRKKKKLPPKPVEQMSYGEARELFVEEFVNVNGIKNLDDSLLPAVLDFAFNSGPDDAVRTLQRLVGAEDDGIIGPKTLKKINKKISESGERSFLDSYMDARVSFINEAAQTNPDVEQFRNGIVNRIEDVRNDVLN